MSDEALKEKTRKTAQMLFHSLKGGTGFDTWKKFDRELARELRMFFTGKLYSREVISQQQRELCAVASLTVLNRPRAARPYPRRAQRGREPPGGGRGGLPAGHLRRHAGGGRGPGRVQGGAARSGASGSDPPLDPTVAAAVEAARVAGEVALQYYRGGFEVTIKADQTPVTQADREAEQAIRRCSGGPSPTTGSSARSSARRDRRGAAGSSTPSTAPRTSSGGIPVWAVLIGLEEDGEVTAGVVFNPVERRARLGAAGRAERTGTTSASACRRSAASPTPPSSTPGSGSSARRPLGRLRPPRRRPRAAPRLRRLLRLRSGRRRQGRDLPRDRSEAVGHGRRQDPGGGSGRAAHGLQGRPTIYDGTVIASNGRLHEAALRLLAGPIDADRALPCAPGVAGPGPSR